MREWTRNPRNRGFVIALAFALLAIVSVNDADANSRSRVNSRPRAAATSELPGAPTQPHGGEARSTMSGRGARSSCSRAACPHPNSRPRAIGSSTCSALRDVAPAIATRSTISGVGREFRKNGRRLARRRPARIFPLPVSRRGRRHPSTGLRDTLRNGLSAAPATEWMEKWTTTSFARTPLFDDSSPTPAVRRRGAEGTARR